MNSGSGATPGKATVPAGGGRRATTGVVVHFALILAAVAVATILARRGDGTLLRAGSIGILIVTVLLYVAMIMIARRAGGALGNGTGYALCAGGAVCMLVAQFATEFLAIVLLVLSGLLFVGGSIAFALQIRQLGRVN